MDRRGKIALLITLVGITFYVALDNMGSIFSAVFAVLRTLQPIVIGLILAVFLNVPMVGYNKLFTKWFSRFKHKPKAKFIHMLSFFVTIVSIITVIVLVSIFVVPEIRVSISKILTAIQNKIPELQNSLNESNAPEWIKDKITDLEGFITSMIADGAGDIINTAKNMVISTVSTTISSLFALIIALYTLVEKRNLCRHATHIRQALFKQKTSDFIERFCKMFTEYFSKFITGQTIEALILGVLIYIGFRIFGLPYPELICLFTSVCALIPYIGAYVSLAVAAILTYLVAPGSVITCIIVYFVIQFVENQFIYPHVVGGSVGLSPLMTLVAALVGGNLFGVIGILFFIPLSAVVFAIYNEYIEAKVSLRDIEKVSEEKAE